jgi:hypothetical protein
MGLEMAKKQKIRTKNERVIISDILPYEIPATFSNRFFYNFLVNNGIKEESLQTIRLKEPAKTIFQKLILQAGLPKNLISNPFTFKISHKETEFRELAICHPRNQIKLVSFYDKYKHLIIYYCSLSNFSIRKPIRVARYTFFNDKKHDRKLSKDTSLLENFDKEYQTQKTYFVYKDYSNVHQFYESNKFHRCEKKYNHLLKLDISKCFDSIYTHTISWALIGKDAVKQDKSTINKSEKTFAGEFDSLMQELNHNETNGIIIGPEFARIFAELILQAVDVSVEKKLLLENLTHRVNYEIFRYVDDYFIFYNDEIEKKVIVETLQSELKSYKLSLNSNKEKVFDKPIITEITIAKDAINKLLSERLNYTLDTEPSAHVCSFLGAQTIPAECKSKSTFCSNRPLSKIHVVSNKLITEFKTIIKQSNVEYRDVINYTLMLIERYSVEILERHKRFLSSYDDFIYCEKHHNSQNIDLESIKKKYRFSKETLVIQSIIEILELTFFIASVSPRVATTIRLSRISSLFVEYLNNNEQKIHDIKNQVFKVISDNSNLILKKNKINNYRQIETLYLLLMIDQLGKGYRLAPQTLMSFLNLEENTTGNLIAKSELNYFVITVALLYIKNIPQYEIIKSCIERSIVEKFEKHKASLNKHAELVLLALDIIACPFVSDATKDTLLDFYKITDYRRNVKSFTNEWFTNWCGFNFNKALDAKQSREVY